ncbi:unnamed protein product [Boreogadus saida]
MFGGSSEDNTQNSSVSDSRKNVDRGVTEWTSWFNIDHPGGNGDYERLEAIRFYYRERVCTRPSAMEARTTDWVAAAETGEVVHSSLEKGFWCVNKEQPYGRTCSNYHVRFHCPPVQAYWTDWSEWGSCSTEACGDVGVQVRQRRCVSNQPVPLLLVPACQGPHSERRECSTAPCTGDRPGPVLGGPGVPGRGGDCLRPGGPDASSPRGPLLCLSL